MLEDLPGTGAGFVTETLVPLAARYGIQVDSAPLTEEELYEMDTYRAYRVASDYLTHGKKTKGFDGIIKERKWSSELLEYFGVGCIGNRTAFRAHLKTAGFPASFLNDVDLSREDIFGEDRVIFTIKDEGGRPVGFAARNLNFNGKKESGSKYCNQRHTGIKCNIYRKSERLYGMHNVLKHRQKGQNTVYIFEGYSDVLTAAEHGLNNCVAVGGTALTMEQVQLLKQYGYYELVLCLDGDEKGQQRTEALLDTVLAGHKDLSVRIMIIPREMDPDDYIRDKGTRGFSKLKRQSAFEWRLSRFDPEAQDDQVCKAMIPLIVNETSYIEQENQCRILAKTTGVSLKAIQSELGRLQNLREAEKARERGIILDRMKFAIDKSPSEAEFVIQEAENKLYELARKYDEDSFSEDSCLSMLDTQKSYEEDKDGSFSGFVLGPQLQKLQDALCGEWKKDVWFCFPGKANTGKTSFVCKLVYEIARHVEENNALVIYHSIDDTAEQILPKFVCVAEGSRQLELNHVTDPNYHVSNIAEGPVRERLRERREDGYTIVRELMRAGRLIVKDANSGSSIAFADRLIRYYKEKYPDRNVVYVLDNFHKLRDFQSLSRGDERTRFKTMSTIIKDVATKHHICVIATVEYRKGDKTKKPGNEDIAETVQIEYDANFVGHIHNEVHEKGERAALSFTHQLNGQPELCPIIEMNIGKNKITAFKNRLWFHFYPSSSDFEGVEETHIAALLTAAKKGQVKEDESILGK
jgi:DNA primase catalytic core